MILARIQAHPTRTHLHGRLCDLLHPLQVEAFIHQSDPPDPGANYRQCLADIPAEYSHVLIVQDDAIPAPGFPEAVEKIAARWPDAPVCLFMGAFPSNTAARIRRSKPDVRYVPLGPSSFMPLVCVLWPTYLAKHFYRWSATAARMTRADDGNAARWVRYTKQQVMVAVPSIVQHNDGEPSVKGGRAHKPWAESWRQALFLAEDASVYEW